MALTNAQMQDVIRAGGSVFWPPDPSGAPITTIAGLPSDAAIAAYVAAHGPSITTPNRIVLTDAFGALTTNANLTVDAATGAILFKDMSGTEQFAAAKYATLSHGIFRGSSGSPVTAAGPLFKATKYENLDTTAMGGNPADSAANALFVAISTGALTNFPQVTGFYGLAQGGGTTTGSDAAGVIGVGIISNVGSTSWGMGAYFEGRSAVAGGRWYGAEISPNNQTGADAAALVNNACNPGTGIWVPSRGPNLNAVGVAVGAVGGSPGYRVGFMVNAASATEASFREDSSAVLGMDIRGTHTYGIDLHLATLSAAGMMLPNNKSLAGKSTGGGDVPLIVIGGNNHVQVGATANPVDINGVLSPLKGATFPNWPGTGSVNDFGLNFTDTAGTTIPFLSMQSDNTIHMGPQFGPASAGQVIFYASATTPGGAPIEAARINPGGGIKLANTAFGAFNKTPVGQQTGGVATASTTTYGSNEAGMLQRLYDGMRTYGWLT